MKTEVINYQYKDKDYLPAKDWLPHPISLILTIIKKIKKIRIITNKPDTSEFSAMGDMTLKMMGEGESSYDFSGVVNVPITDNFAIRAVGFTAEDGGFIDVVDGQSARFGLNNNSTFNPSVVRDDVNTFKSSGCFSSHLYRW